MSRPPPASSLRPRKRWRFYRTPGGREPVRDFLYSAKLSDGDAAAIADVFNRAFLPQISDRMLKLAKANLARAGLLERAHLRCRDAAALPYGDGSIDTVFMSFRLELFDTPEIPKVLAECKRVLRAGGRILAGGGGSKGGHHDPLRIR